jgi:hypothetical protein
MVLVHFVQTRRGVVVAVVAAAVVAVGVGSGTGKMIVSICCILREMASR